MVEEHVDLILKSDSALDGTIEVINANNKVSYLIVLLKHV